MYIRETSRNAFYRGREHFKGLESLKDDPVLVENLKECHEGDTSHPHGHKFKMNVTACHKTALDRMVT